MRTPVSDELQSNDGHRLGGHLFRPSRSRHPPSPAQQRRAHLRRQQRQPQGVQQTGLADHQHARQQGAGDAGRQRGDRRPEQHQQLLTQGEQRESTSREDIPAPGQGRRQRGVGVQQQSVGESGDEEEDAQSGGVGARPGLDRQPGANEEQDGGLEEEHEEAGTEDVQQADEEVDAGVGDPPAVLRHPARDGQEQKSNQTQPRRQVGDGERQEAGQGVTDDAEEWGQLRPGVEDGDHDDQLCDKVQLENVRPQQKKAVEDGSVSVAALQDALEEKTGDQAGEDDDNH